MDQARDRVVHRRVGRLLVVLRVDSVDVRRLAGVERDVADGNARELRGVHDRGGELNTAEVGHRLVASDDLEDVRVAG